MTARQIRRPVRIVFFSLTIICAAATLLAPRIGLGEQYEFVPYRSMGISRSAALSWLLWLIFIFVLCDVSFPFVLDFFRAPKRWARMSAVAKSIWVDGAAIAEQLTNPRRLPVTGHDLWNVTVLIAVFAAVAAIFISKNLLLFKQSPDLHWWQAMADYGVEWGTPVFSFGGNLLYDFGIQVPLKARLLPIEGAAHWFPIDYRIVATLSIYFLATAALFWVIGALFGLNLIYRTIFAGSVALLTTIPAGLDRVLPFLPPMFLTHQFLCAFWWGEAPLLLAATITAFFLVGRQMRLVMNVAASVAFSAGAFTPILSYPTGAVYFVPMIAVYCATLFLTSESRDEFIWKGAVSGLLLTIMLIAHVPQFFQNLYSYSLGGYFFGFSREGTSLQANFLVLSHIDDLRGFFFYAIAFAAVAVAALKSKGALHRIALAVLVCELAIILITNTNIWLGIPLPGAYAELAHAPLWASFFVLAVMIGARLIDQRLARWKHSRGTGQSYFFQRAIERRRSIYGAVFLFLLASYWLFPRPGIAGMADSLFQRAGTTNLADYPPKRPPPVELLAQDLALEPGSEFRGRLMMVVPANLTGPSDWIKVVMVIHGQYRPHLGNDFYHDLLPFNIPMLNEYAFWTGPPTFAFYRVFFGKEGETFGRDWFVLSQFDLRIARLVGVRMVLTDGSNIPGGTLVYETKAGDNDLRIFRIDDTNFGQYSPTRTEAVRTAADAIASIKDGNFDPKRDVVVESRIPADLQPATAVRVTVSRGPTLAVRATSAGRSLLVLPFEFSHCLQLKSENGRAQLMPVNLLQTGLLFEGNLDAEISYRFGLFQNSYCRGEDIKRADDLQLKDALIRNDRLRPLD